MPPAVELRGRGVRGRARARARARGRNRGSGAGRGNVPLNVVQELTEAYDAFDNAEARIEDAHTHSLEDQGDIIQARGERRDAFLRALDALIAQTQIQNATQHDFSRMLMRQIPLRENLASFSTNEPQARLYFVPTPDFIPLPDGIRFPKTVQDVENMPINDVRELVGSYLARAADNPERGHRYLEDEDHARRFLKTVITGDFEWLA